MFCQICGARVPEGRSACVQCGAPAGRVAGYTPAARNLSMEVRSCPRCGYQGASQSYFSTPGHMVMLAALTLASGGPLGILYFILRAGHRVCPSCGEGWGKGGQLAIPAGGQQQGTSLAEIPGEVASMSEGGAKTFFSWAFFAFAALMITIGIGAGEAVPFALALFAGGGGYLLRRSASEDRLRRREAILQSLQRPVLQLAAQRGGTLTVTEVASEYGWSIPRAEKVLQSLEDGYRVMGDVTSEGVIVYNFLELVPVPSSQPRTARAFPGQPVRPKEEVGAPRERSGEGDSLDQTGTS